MRYQPPSGIGDPNAPYVDFNPVSGEAGSIPPARAIEAPQREIVHVITATGQTPNEDDNTQLYQSIVAMIERVAQIPAGALMPFAGSTVPTGWLACNGASVRKADYPALYEAIRDTYTNISSTDNFDLPDYRGEFIRGLDAGRGIDRNRELGTLQDGEVGPHTHPFRLRVDDRNTSQRHQHVLGRDHDREPLLNPVYWNYTTAENTGTETRPRNVAALICIKY